MACCSKTSTKLNEPLNDITTTYTPNYSLPGNVSLVPRLPEGVQHRVDIHETEVLKVLLHVGVGAPGAVARVVEHVVVAVVADHVALPRHAQNQPQVLRSVNKLTLFYYVQ